MLQIYPASYIFKHTIGFLGRARFDDNINPLVKYNMRS
jgi:hypothetical protein